MKRKDQKTNLVFINSSKSVKFLKRLEKFCNDTDEMYVMVDLAENRGVQFPARRNIIHKSCQDYTNYSRNFDHAKIIEWINAWGNHKFNNVELKEILSYDAISLYRMAITPYLASIYRTICQKIDMAEVIIRAEMPDKIMLWNGIGEWKKTIITICKFRDIKYCSIQNGPELNKIIKLRIKPILAIFYLSVRDYIRKYLSKSVYLFRKTKFSMKGKKKIIFFSQPPYWRNVYDVSLKKERKADDILDNIINMALEDNTSVVGLDVDYSKGQFKIFFEKLMSEKKFFWFPVEFYYTEKINSVSNKIAKGIIQKWKGLLKDKLFQDSISYGGIPLFDLIRGNLFFELIPFNIFCAIRYVEAMKSMIKKERPALIILAYESGPCGRAAVIAADLGHVPTLAIQHGIIHKLHLDYILPKGTLSGDKRFLDCSIPARTAVYGDFAKHILTGISNYPVDAVVVTGQPRYDTLVRMISTPGIRQEVLNRLGINPYKKIILVATASIGKVYGQIGGQVPMIKAILSSILGLDDVRVIIKLHPLEKETKSIYKKIAEDMKLSAQVTIIEQINIFELIIACDLFITQNSTSSYEALIAGKPVLIIEFSSKISHTPFIEDNVAIGVNDAESVKKVIIDLLYHPDSRANLNNNREDFIYRHCYKSDGLATRRVLDLMYGMIGRKEVP